MVVIAAMLLLWGDRPLRGHRRRSHPDRAFPKCRPRRRRGAPDSVLGILAGVVALVLATAGFAI
ncbi:hypothetical protein NOVOSPHI9U_800007 [Novosphingobium sp. 9U]|nr:hypothetical protein NOVOSPHI9U_800007 [Novosphingobium sp. 9U]